MRRLIPLLIAAPLATSVSAQRPVAPPPTPLPTSAPRPPVEVSLEWYAVGKPVKPKKRGQSPGHGDTGGGGYSQEPLKS